MTTLAQEMVLAVEDAGERLDRYLADRLPDVSRAELQRWIKQGRVQVDGLAAKPSQRLAPGDVVSLRRPAEQAVEVLPEPIPLSVIYEDADLLVVDKPAGMVVHPAPGHHTGTLVNALLARSPDLALVGGEERAGVVHRLDRDTSGLLLVAKNPAGLAALQAQFKARTVRKTYLALVEGLVDVAEGRVDAPVGRDPAHRQRMAVVSVRRGGRPAMTTFRVRGHYEPRVSSQRVDLTLLELDLHTGRTHQVRVHLAFIKHPVVGDRVYGRRRQQLHCPRQFLHAARLAFVQPTSGLTVSLEAPLAPDLQAVLDSLREIE